MKFKRLLRYSALFGCVLICVVALSSYVEMNGADADEPSPADRLEGRVDFRTEIKPLLEQRCGKCHTQGQANGGYSFNTRESFLKGGESGAAVVPGKSSESLLIKLVSGADPDRIMPQKGERLTKEQITVLKAWIDQGVKWPKTFRFSKRKQVVINGKAPPLPKAAKGSGLTNPIDLFLQTHFKAHAAESRGSITDQRFARRASLDLVGLPPTAEQLDALVADQRPGRRQRFVRHLLNDRSAYAAHWMTFWNDALRNTYRGTGFIDGGRSQITGWLYKSLHENKPYDQFVHELISPVDGSEGFVKGIIWRGVVNASQRRELQAAQNISQVFFGLNLKCASCHDSFIDDWKLTDSHGLAAVFADGPFELYYCNKPTGQMAEVKFLFPELGEIDTFAPREERMKQLADILTSKGNSRFSQTMVNRLWAAMMGRGLIEPVDEMDGEAWNADLLDWLAADLVEHEFDLKHTLAMIADSRAYQMPAVGAPRPDEEEFTFGGPLVKRMTAEQFVDALAYVTRVPRPSDPEMLKRDGRGQGGQLMAIRDVLASTSEAGDREPLELAKWIWNDAAAASGVSGGRLVFRKTVTLASEPTKVMAAVSCDNEFDLYVNGQKVAGGKVWNEPATVDLTGRLKAGDNVIAVRAVNQPLPKKGEKSNAEEKNPAGFVFLASGTDADGQRFAFGSDASWMWLADEPAGWETREFDARGWQHAVEVAGVDGGPWKLAGQMLGALRIYDEPLRAAFESADPLTRSLGRSNREQVVTHRESLATMLQTLELANGTTLDTILNDGAKRWMADDDNDPASIAESVYQRALGRSPNESERGTAIELLGSPATPSGIADMLWVIVMLPEFQLIY